MPEQHCLPGTTGQPEAERSPQDRQCHTGASASASYTTCCLPGHGGSASCSLAGARAHLSPVTGGGGGQGLPREPSEGCWVEQGAAEGRGR